MSNEVYQTKDSKQNRIESMNTVKKRGREGDWLSSVILQEKEKKKCLSE